MYQALVNPEFSARERAIGTRIVQVLWFVAYGMLGVFLLWAAADPLAI